MPDLGPDAPTTNNFVSEAPGAQLGPYRLLQVIGEGGMGQVWIAEQKSPVFRRVAIKLIKAGMDTREVVARFESERQTLALMDHPCIAKIFDAGSTPHGRPYFAMEYVNGIPVTAYCDQHKLTTRQRLELFVRVCEGVQHAHQKAIIHRDLKPSNILVSESDGRPLPRIIDFGVAKATAQPLTPHTMYTRVGVIVGTPEYMSPEQADSAGQDIDTRTDVYSLGVILYELLVGDLPLRFDNLPLDQIPRRLREDDTPRPSTKLRLSGGQSAAAAQNRGVDIQTLARQIRGDLDAVALKALEKDRSRRYASASELAADIGRFLRSEPVLACPASAAYRVRKYVQRHRLGVGLAAGVAVLVVAFAITQTVELHRITRERDRANRITNFMLEMFKVSDPGEARGNTITAREILDKSSGQIETGLSRDPELQAQLMDVMASVYAGLGIYSREEQLLSRATGIRRRILGPQNPVTLISMNNLAGAYYNQGRFADSEKLHLETLNIRLKLFGPRHRDSAESMNNLANALQREGRYSEAEKLHRQALETDTSLFGPENKATLECANNLANDLRMEHRYAEAEKLLRESLELRRRTLGPDHPETLDSIGNLANVVDLEGNHQEAEQLLREILVIQRRILGPEHQRTLSTINDLANALLRQQRYDEAGKLLTETLEVVRRTLGPEHPQTAVARFNLGCIAVLQGHIDEGLAMIREAIDHGLSAGDILSVEQDDSLTSLHGDPRFAALVAYARQRAAAKLPR